MGIPSFFKEANPPYATYYEHPTDLCQAAKQRQKMVFAVENIASGLFQGVIDAALLICFAH